MLELIIKKNIYYIFNKDQNITTKLEPETVLKFLNILNQPSIDDEKLNYILEKNVYYYLYNLTIKKLTKQYTKAEIRNYLKKKTDNNYLINKIIKNIEDLGYINDVEYAKNYISLKQNLYSITIIENKLKEKGVFLKDIKQAIDLVDYNQNQCIKKIIKKNLSKIKGSKIKFQENLILKLINMGFSEEIVSKMVLEEINSISYNEVSSLEKDYKILYLKISKVESNTDILKTKVRLKLLNKGYSLENIKKVEENDFR